MAINRLFPTDDSSNDVMTAQLQAGVNGAALPPFVTMGNVMIPGAAFGYAQWQQAVLQMAYQLARIIVAPPRHETLFTSSWN